MIRAVIFDLDYCLLETREIPASVYQPAFDAIRRQNGGRLTDEALEKAFADAWKHPIDDVADRHGFSPEMLAAAKRHFAEARVEGPLSGYDDLHVLGEIDALRFLVTTGYRALQESKVEALGILGLFDGVYVDVIDAPDRRGKEGHFREIMAAYDLRPVEVMVVGDNTASEIEAGNRLGMVTVQILRPGVERGTNARHLVHSLREILPLLKTE